MNDHGAARWRPRNEVPMLDEKHPPVTHVNGERPKRLRGNNILEFLDGHNGIIPKASYPGLTPHLSGPCIISSKTAIFRL